MTAVIIKCYVLESSEFLIYQKLNLETETTVSFSTVTQGFHFHNFPHSQPEIFQPYHILFCIRFTEQISAAQTSVEEYED